MPDEFETRRLTRRGLIKRAGAGAAGIAFSGVLAEPAWAQPRTVEASNTIKLGFVSPLTGPLAGFGEGDPYIIGLAKHAWRNGMTIGGKHYAVQIINKDTQSDPAKAAQVANELIHKDGIDLMLVTSTPEVVNPVADA